MMLIRVARTIVGVTHVVTLNGFVTTSAEVHILILLCNSRKYPYLPCGRSMEIPRERGWQKKKVSKKSMDWNNLPEGITGGGMETK